MKRPAVFDSLSEPVPHRLVGGFERVALALRSGAWRDADPAGVTPTQAQALRALHEAKGGLRLAELAAQLGVSAPTMSARVSTLVAKGLVVKESGPDKRSVGLRLTDEGRALLERPGAATEMLSGALDVLDPLEQERLLRSLVKVVRALQVQGAVAPQRMCVTCVHFRPHAHPDARLPHHCDYVDAPFGVRHLRLACPEQADAPVPLQESNWERFTTAGEAPPGPCGHP